LESRVRLVALIPNEIAEEVSKILQLTLGGLRFWRGRINLMEINRVAGQ
jgi:hypothetical protein